jgi:hypothetical protein
MIVDGEDLINPTILSSQKELSSQKVEKQNYMWSKRQGRKDPI